MFDLRLRKHFRCIVVGPSQSGKSVFTRNILTYSEELFEEKSAYTVYYYNIYQPIFDFMKRDKVVDEFIQGIPSIDDIKELSSPFINKGGTTIVLDDFANHTTKDIAELFAVGSHHLHLNIFWLCQNFFAKNRYQRDISLNATYIAFFKSPRDTSSIRTFGRQFSPVDKNDYIAEAYHKVTRKPYGYLFFDFHQKTPDSLRVRSDILPHEAPMKAWIPKHCTI